MKSFVSRGVFLALACSLVGVAGYEARSQEQQARSEISFKQDVVPIIKRYCLPCHAEDNYNPSELSLDTYDQLMAGGKHGASVVPGKSNESILITKLSSKPPFGDPMPLKKKRDPEQKLLTSDELKTLADWVDQGAKND